MPDRPMIERTKAALIRDPRIPAGQPAPLSLRCCGELVPVDDDGATCPRCLTAYDAAGWILRRPAPAFEPSAWEQARRLGRRCFYERTTETLRACPENYLVAVRVLREGRAVYLTEHQGRPALDAALWPYRAAIDAVISEWADGSTADALADAIGEVLPPRLVMRTRVRHIDTTTGAVQLERIRSSTAHGWSSPEAFSRARLATAAARGPITREAIPGGIRETDRRATFTAAGFYVVSDITLEEVRA